MGNRSVYLDEDEEEYVEEHIANFSDFTRTKIREAMKRQDQVYIQQERSRKRSLLLNFSAFGIGLCVLAFVVILNTMGTGSYVYMSMESLLLIIIGLALEVIAINKLYNYKNGVENVKKI